MKIEVAIIYFIAREILVSPTTIADYVNSSAEIRQSSTLMAASDAGPCE